VLDLTDAKRRLVDRLRRVDDASASELATEFGLTDTAVRQHLDTLVEAGLVRRLDGVRSGRGRPAGRWQLTEGARTLFPDRHGDLAVELLASIEATLGPDAVDRILDERAARQTAEYRAVIGADGPHVPVEVRVQRLADRRTAEGYEAEVVVDGEELVLVEHHCPVCAAATACRGLCRSELEVFSASLGDDVVVRREQHLLSGDQRCAYRITVTPSVRPSR
jgi:predicted ArsR family transcriptional regulator